MAVLTATEKLKILVSGKATLKELNDLEKQAETEALETPEPKETEPKETEAKETEPKETETKDSVSIEEYNKLLAKIDEMDTMLKEAQQENVNGNSGGKEPSFDEQLNDMFKDVRF